MIGDLLIENGKTISPLSAYQPSLGVRELTQLVKKNYQVGDDNMQRPFEEFNGLSVIGRMNEDQKAWLSWNPPASNDPEEDWRWFGIRPITRNKVISTAAHLTSQLLFPNVFAQNELDEEDRDASYVARELIEYNVRHSNYETCFLYGVISGLVNPATFFKVDYCEAYQDILDGTQSNFTKKKVLDEVFSGFQNSLIPCDEILIANPYQFDIQKQEFLMHRRRISYDEAEALYGTHENFKYIQKGVRTMLNSENGLFYDIDDYDGELVEEVTLYRRRDDLQVCFINGIYLGNNNTEFNPIAHRTNKNKPRYQFAKFGAEPIDAMRFFYYKSLVAKISNDQEAIDREWQMYFDAGFLSTFPPVITAGAGKIDRSVIVPATVTDIKAGATITPLTTIANPMAALSSLREAERSLTESSQDPQMEGMQQGTETARGRILLQENAETNLGIMGRMIGIMVKDIGTLMLDDIIRYQTVGNVTEILGGVPQMKYRTFIVENKVKEGKNVTEYIRFTDRYAGKKMSKKEKEAKEISMYEEAGDNKHIYEVNPALFSKMEYLVTVDYDQLMQRNTAFERAFKLEVYDKAIQNPYVDAQAITRDFLLEPLVKGEASKYMKDVEAVMPGMVPGQATGQTAPTAPQQPNGQNLTSRLVKSVAMENPPMGL